MYNYIINYYNNKDRHLYRQEGEYIESYLDLFGASFDIRKSTITYTAKPRFHKALNKLLSKYKVPSYSISKILNMLHEDINKLELYINLKGFEHGFYDYTIINSLESLALSYYGVEALYERTHLFEFSEDPAIEELKSIYKKKLRYINYQNLDNRRIIHQFAIKKIKPIIMDLNNLVDKQLMLHNGEIVYECEEIREEDLEEVFEYFKVFLFKYSDQVYFNAYWKSANQRVLKRYR